MSISIYQIHNVLRTYSKMLGLEKPESPRENPSFSLKTDEVTISSEAKKKQIMDLMTQEMIEKLTTKDSTEAKP